MKDEIEIMERDEYTAAYGRNGMNVDDIWDFANL